MDIVAAMDDPGLFGPWFSGPSWDGWRTVLKAAFGLPLSNRECDFFRSVAEREPPSGRVRELWIVVGRRGGKDSVASLIAAHAAALFDQPERLRPGERALVMCLAVDRDQSKIVLSYTRSYFTDIPLLQGMVTRKTANGFELENGVDIAIATNNFRSVRGRPVLCAIFDEVAFWRDEASTTPDEETYKAVIPGMATIPGAMLVGISSPYRKAGLLYKKYRDHFGRDGDILVIRAPSILLNPTLDQTIIDRALADDYAAAAAEWLAEFRTDIETFISSEAVEATIVPGRLELPPVPGVKYIAFTDPAGGSGTDSMTLCIGHQGQINQCAVIDAIREVKPPFSPDTAIQEFAALLKSYGVHEVFGDRWGGEFPRERYRVYGVEYMIAERPKSDIYRDALPVLNSGRAELLDHPHLKAQLCSLERRTVRGGRDSIDHPPGRHDDIANAVAGVLVQVTNTRPATVITDEMVAQVRAYRRSRPFFY